MEQAVVDKGYMAQLVEVQQMRGAAGGKEFHKLLTQEEDEVKEIPKVKGQCRVHSVISIDFENKGR